MIVLSALCVLLTVHGQVLSSAGSGGPVVPGTDVELPAAVEGWVREFVAEDFSRLINDKERTDWLVSLAWLPHELRGTGAHALFPLLSHTYTPVDRQAWAHSQKGASSLSETERQPWRAQFTYCAWANIGQDYPMYYSGQSGFDGSALVIGIDWYEPFLSNRFVGFALAPERLGLRWNGPSADVTHLRSGPILNRREFAAHDPVFNNEPFFFHPRHSMDALRSHWLPIARKAAGGDVVEGPVAASSVDGRWSRGPVVRSVSRIAAGTRDRLLLNMEPFTIEQFAPTPIDFTVDGRAVSLTPKRNQALLSGGRTVEIALPSGDSPFIDVSISSGGVTLGFGRVSDMRYGAMPGAMYTERERAHTEVGERLNAIYAALHAGSSAGVIRFYRSEDCAVADPVLRRQRIKANIFNAVRLGSKNQLSEWFDAYERMILAEGVPSEFVIFNAEAVMRLAAERGTADVARHAVMTVLGERFRALSPREKQVHLLRAIEGMRFDGAWLYANALASDGTASPTLRDWARARRRDIEETKSFKHSDMPDDAVYAMDAIELLDRIQALSSPMAPSEQVAP